MIQTARGRREGRRRLLIAEDAKHVRPVAREVLAAEVARRQQEHDALVEEGEADPLLPIEVIDVLLEQMLVRIALPHESYHSEAHEKKDGD